MFIIFFSFKTECACEFGSNSEVLRNKCGTQREWINTKIIEFDKKLKMFEYASIMIKSSVNPNILFSVTLFI